MEARFEDIITRTSSAAHAYAGHLNTQVKSRNDIIKYNTDNTAIATDTVGKTEMTQRVDAGSDIEGDTETQTQRQTDTDDNIDQAKHMSLLCRPCLWLFLSLMSYIWKSFSIFHFYISSLYYYLYLCLYVLSILQVIR